MNNRLKSHIDIITLMRPLSGCQLSICVRSDNKTGQQVFDAIEAAGVTCDWREPNVIRVAPVPLYNSYTDCLKFVDILESVL